MTKDMTEGNPLLLILKFTLPLLAGNLLQQGYNVADAAIVAGFLVRTLWRESALPVACSF